jgi:two-component system nitrate/nitrite response regulator NarL
MDRRTDESSRSNGTSADSDHGVNLAVPRKHPGVRDTLGNKWIADGESADDPQAPIELIFLSDIRFLREGLAEVFARDQALKIRGIAATLAEALSLIGSIPPQIFLIDTALPNGLAAVRRLREFAPHMMVAALAVIEEEAEIIAWAEAGVSGYVPRNVGLTDLVGFLKHIVCGGQPCSTQVAASLLRWIASSSSVRCPERALSAAPQLTVREEQVVRLICAGLTNKAIARHLNIGLATIKSHVHNVLGKLELERRSQVVLWTHNYDRVFGEPKEQEMGLSERARVTDSVRSPTSPPFT